MPFTAAHPAIILPLLKRFRLSATGLVIGSIAPDFEYFIRLETFSAISHSLTGLLLFDIPATFLLALLYHMLVRDLVVENLPPYFKARALAVRKVNWPRYIQKNWFLFLISAAIGSASHIFWDGFTHNEGFFVTEFPLLQTKVALFGFPASVCRIIQHVSTVVGLVAVYLYIDRCPTVPVPESTKGHRHWLYFWLKIFSMGVAFLLLNLLLRYQPIRIPDIIATLISGWLLVLLAASFYARLRNTV